MTAKSYWKPNNAILKKTTYRDFFRQWLIALREEHGLTSREIDLAAAYVRRAYELGRSVSDLSLVQKILAGDEVKRELRNEAGMSESHYHVSMMKLKKGGIILPDGSVAAKWIPNISGSRFGLLMMFDITDLEDGELVKGSN